MRLRPTLTRLLVLLLLMQWGTAFGHCLKLAAPHDLLHMDICTAEGMRSVALPLDEADGQAPAGDHAAAMPCPVCGGPGAASLPTPPFTLVAPLLLVQTVDPPPPSTPSPAPPPRCQPPPRAPPTS
ncbi:DUF2946 family protein [Falsiroseomonas sp. E2-1-a20]|uniref:DUF2946 family protein n=1 Tax=Falsiroseomonas sp. E2-1-a20 TaxID=3239300 RepID=UPI003F3A227F